ncbi:MAG: tRNA (guanosine(46)-N7)-methyltransferase TrmB [Clostridium sp.]|nr:tRNA (guanosine(46)-N7)-methyltransferase TrmB [Clostridium sp.]MCM1444350.1 tRNA (guanosine(46)-N7)-methyltransferase TrmB [Candidatus Amulumruptor caecigallinarius]
MRLKKVKGAEEKVNSSKYIIEKPDYYKGKYNKLFNNNNELHLEIGMGKGTFIINKALTNPNINYIGIEKYDSVIVRAVEKIENMEIPNLKLIRMDANNIEEIFDKEIDKIYLNFSDPWPKERHAKRRLSSSEFLNKYNNIFKNKKIIQMKTDNRKLFEYSLKSFIENGYKIDDISLDLYNDDIKDNIPTEYEIKFSSLGQTIYMVSVSK